MHNRCDGTSWAQPLEIWQRSLKSRSSHQWLYGLLIPVFAVVAAEDQSNNQQRNWGQDAGLRAGLSACEPLRTGKRGIEQIAVRYDAAIRNSVEVSLSPVV